MENTKRKGLIPHKSGKEMLDMYFLEARSHLLETAAILDRIERTADGDTAMKDPRIETLFKICQMLTQAKSNRAEQFLNLLSVS